MFIILKIHLFFKSLMPLCIVNLYGSGLNYVLSDIQIDYVYGHECTKLT